MSQAGEQQIYFTGQKSALLTKRDAYKCHLPMYPEKKEKKNVA